METQTQWAVAKTLQWETLCGEGGENAHHNTNGPFLVGLSIGLQPLTVLAQA